MPIQAAFMSGGFVFVNQALGGHAVDNRDGGAVRGAGSLFIEGLNGFLDLLHVGA